jgi:putative PIN family toxin of toxin-antitoxin system
LVAAFAARGLCADLLSLVILDHELVVTQVVADEVRRILSAKLKVSAEALSSVEAVLERCEIVPRGDYASPIALRDPDDEHVLAAAVHARVEIVITGDDDLLSVARESPIRILSPRAFMTLVRGTL